MPHENTLNHKIWYLAWPMILANISVPLLGLVDAAILGHLDSALYLASVAVGSSVLSFLYWGFGFLRMGTTGLTAQAYGAHDHNQSRLIIGQSIVLGLGLGVLVVILSPLLLRAGLHWIAPPPGAYEYALTYSAIRVFSAPAVLINYGVIGWLIGRQNTRWPLLITVFCNSLNLILDCILIFGLGMKSEGAALATLIAEYSGCAMAIWVVRTQLANTPGSLNRSRLWHWTEYRELILVNRHLFVRSLTLLACFAFFTAQGAKQGSVVLAANTLIINLLMLTSFGLDGFAHAAESLVGDATGQRNRVLFFNTCRQCAIWCVITALVYTLVFLLAGESLLSLLTSIDQVHRQASQYLPWLLALPMLAVWSYLFDGIFIGTTQTQTMQSTMLFSALVVYLPCWYLTRQWGNHGLWFAFVVFSLTRGISLGWYFYRFAQPWRWWRETNI